MIFQDMPCDHEPIDITNSESSSDASQFIEHLSKKYKEARNLSFISCDDIIFSIIDASLRKLEPGIS